MIPDSTQSECHWELKETPNPILTIHQLSFPPSFCIHKSPGGSCKRERHSSPLLALIKSAAQTGGYTGQEAQFTFPKGSLERMSPTENKLTFLELKMGFSSWKTMLLVSAHSFYDFEYSRLGFKRPWYSYWMKAEWRASLYHSFQPGWREEGIFENIIKSIQLTSWHFLWFVPVPYLFFPPFPAPLLTINVRVIDHREDTRRPNQTPAFPLRTREIPLFLFHFFKKTENLEFGVHK